MNLSDQLLKPYSISSPPKKGGKGSMPAPYGARGLGAVTPRGGKSRKKLSILGKINAITCN
jgi:hypothetical protein